MQVISGKSRRFIEQERKREIMLDEKEKPHREQIKDEK